MAKTPAELYEERIKRINDAVQLKVPDRVPTLIDFGYLAAKYSGMTVEEAFYDCDKWVMANRKIVTDFEPDIFHCNRFESGAAYEAVNTRIMKWPGHGVPPNSTHQYVEGEYMNADEYDALINDPADFIVRTYLPRTSGALESFKKLPHLSDFAGVGRAFGAVSLFADPGVVAACQSLHKAALEVQKWDTARLAFIEEIKELGFPAITGMGGLSPFDHISDHLRGMRGAMLDMYQRPDRLLEAMEKLFPILIKSAVSAAKRSGSTLLFTATHRGSEGFMSLKHFKKFYWPGLKAHLLALIDAGLTPYIFWEGDYTSRLEYLLELPKGKVLNRFDSTDFFKAKEVLGGHHCIAGGIMPSLLQIGTVQDVKDYCRKMIDVVGKDGGYIMSTSCVMDEARPENVRAMIDFTKEYGQY